MALLCTHYRNSGQYQLCCEFALIGLRIPFPREDSLFIDAGLYHWFFRQEVAIAGFYAATPSHRELGRQFCQQLAVTPGFPEQVRNTARGNLRFYAPQATSWLNMQTLAQFEVERPEGWSNFNPSVCTVDGESTVLLRLANYQLQHGRYHIADSHSCIRSRSLLIHLDESYQPVTKIAVEEVARTGAARTDFPVQGYEDGRLIRHDGHWWISSTVRNTTAEGRCEMALLKLSEQGRIEQEYLLRGPWSDKHQKNWMPFVHLGQIHFVYSLCPTVILQFDEAAGKIKEISRNQPAAELDQLRGGGQLLPMQDGNWIGISHEVSVAANNQRHYLHRFFRLSADWQLNGISDAFSLSGDDIEFCGGLTWNQGSTQLLISYGVGDCQAMLSAIALEKLLPHIHRLS